MKKGFARQRITIIQKWAVSHLLLGVRYQGCARDLPARDRDRDIQSRDRDIDNSSKTRPRPPIDRDETETFEEGLETFTLTCRRSSLVILSKYQVKYYYSYILYN